MLPLSNKVNEILSHIREELAPHYDEQEIRSFSFILLEEYCKLSRNEVLSGPSKTVSESELLKIHFAVKELKNSKPIQYIIGKSWFCGLELTVNPGVLIPRPETEELVAWILADHRTKKQRIRLLDIGTGSGCIALALAKNLPNAMVVAVDNSESALVLARRNAVNNSSVVEFLKLDILNEKEFVFEDPFDIIVSNPPYVRVSEKIRMKKNVLDHEPASALFVSDEDPLIFYRAIFNLAKSSLVKDGALYCELNEALGKATEALAEQNGFAKTELRKDLNGRARMLKCSL